MPFFPPPGVTGSYTGNVMGSNIVNCPTDCKLNNGSPIYYLHEDHPSYSNIYPIQNIPNYYCVINSGPPIPHIQRPEGYTQNAFYITSTDWQLGNTSSEVSIDEMYDNPRSDYMFNAFNSSTSCSLEQPTTDPPLSGDLPTLPKNPLSCINFQDSLNWFRLNIYHK